MEIGKVPAHCSFQNTCENLSYWQRTQRRLFLDFIENLLMFRACQAYFCKLTWTHFAFFVLFVSQDSRSFHDLESNKLHIFSGTSKSFQRKLQKCQLSKVNFRVGAVHRNVYWMSKNLVMCTDITQFMNCVTGEKVIKQISVTYLTCNTSNHFLWKKYLVTIILYVCMYVCILFTRFYANEPLTQTRWVPLSSPFYRCPK